MNSLFQSAWMSVTQAILGLVGTWLLAFGLKSVRESSGFDTTNPSPRAWRFWWGLGILSLAVVPSIVLPLTQSTQSETSSAAPNVSAALVVLTGIYVIFTGWLVREMRRQNAFAAKQFKAAALPLAVVLRESVPGGWEYFVRNVGPGLAVDVVYVRDKGTLGGKLIFIVNHLGVLQSGGSVVVPREASSELSSYSTAADLGHQIPRHVVLARPMSADEWVVTSNEVQPDGGHVHSATWKVRLSTAEMESLASVGAARYIEEHWPQIRVRLEAAGLVLS